MLGKRCPPPIGSHGENGSRHLQGNSAAHWSRTGIVASALSQHSPCAVPLLYSFWGDRLPGTGRGGRGAAGTHTQGKPSKSSQARVHRGGFAPSTQPPTGREGTDLSQTKIAVPAACESSPGVSRRSGTAPACSTQRRRSALAQRKSTATA